MPLPYIISCVPALALLDGYRQESAGWSRSQQMRYELLHAKAQNKACVNFTSDSTMHRVADYGIAGDLFKVVLRFDEA